jgi:hypothetical protein
MQDMLTRIKRAILRGQYAFSKKAQIEMERDRLSEYDVLEAILSATTIYKTIRARSSSRESSHERLYIIQSTNYIGLFIYTKGKWVREKENLSYYFLISSKRGL